MSTALILDLAIVAVILIFILLGAKKGFVLTLCSLIAVVVAFAGANFIANFAAPYVADAIQPPIENAIQVALDQAVDTHLKDIPIPVDKKDVMNLPLSTLGPYGKVIEDGILDALDGLGGMFTSAADTVRDTFKNGLTGTLAQAASAVAANLAAQLAKGIVFVAAFILLLILWGIISHALDLVAKLPVLNQLNATLGGILGFVKGAVIVYVAVWALYDLTGVVTPEMTEGSYVFSFLAQHSPLELLGMK